jgi:hypothetical protein
MELRTESNFDYDGNASMLETNSEFIDYQNDFGDGMPLPEGFLLMDQSNVYESEPRQGKATKQLQ